MCIVVLCDVRAKPQAARGTSVLSLGLQPERSTPRLQPARLRNIRGNARRAFSIGRSGQDPAVASFGQLQYKGCVNGVEGSQHLRVGHLVVIEYTKGDW